MARKKTKRKTKDNKDNKDIKGIISITIGILMIISVFSPGESGAIGRFIKNVLIFIFGLGAFVFPFLIVFTGICLIIRRGKINFNSKFYGIVLFISNTLLLIHMASIDKPALENGIISSMQRLYYSNSIMHGGVLCHIIDIPLYNLFGKLGSIVIFVAIYIISFIMVSQVSLYNVIEELRSKKREQKSVKKLIEEKPEELVAYDSDEEVEKKENKLKVISLFKSSTIEGDKDESSQENLVEKERQINIKFSSENNTKAVDEDIHKQLENEMNREDDFKEDYEYSYPQLNLLNANIASKLNKEDKKELIDNANKLEETLSSFGVEAKVIQVTKGPSVTRFELQPSSGVKVSKIVNLSDDIALSLAASGVRIEAPIPGKSAVGIEVPNRELTSVYLREVLESDEYKNFNKNLAFALGKDIGGNCVVTDLAKMPHLLIAGATGSGKSVCINTLIMSLLFKYSPENVKLLMIDPKVVELSIYNGIPHLLIPVVTEPKKAAGALNWAVNEMTRRYKIFAENNVRNIESYNDLYEKGKIDKKLPLIVMIIDELADLMMVCPNDIEDYIGRLAQMARAAGMHLVIATQRPSVDVITGVIKANIPSRISFAVSSQIDSRTILDMAGAEKLLGKGDMLFYPTGESKPLRIQGAFISEEEVEKVVEFIKNAQEEVEYENSIIEEINTVTKVNEDDKDELLDEAMRIVIETSQASTSLLQRRLRIGYNRAARIIEQLEERGIISGRDGSKPRQILVDKDNME
ncbi:S-DNA-T family DNA segregation ATPase FtsK/SpoIIIE [Clostridium pascui]|uniref:FtsK/SpoIIIE family DNA translocase n=1 Tax=Clostridium pascui TaxID=46609 RepID=UPI001FAEAC77|nr:DNA translocase FtsK [Clostridium pascui]MBM7868996.1 S-DNA-T family DNA segregation ATPase FtsK/SpoIIIE [Clostridium pascui]